MDIELQASEILDKLASRIGQMSVDIAVKDAQIERLKARIVELESVEDEG
jgi:cell division protein FtsB